jgi:hypothetical protein
MRHALSSNVTGAAAGVCAPLHTAGDPIRLQMVRGERSAVDHADIRLVAVWCARTFRAPGSSAEVS